MTLARAVPLLLAAVPAATLLAIPAAVHGQQNLLDCEAERSRPLVPTDPALCASLAEAVRWPEKLPLADYENTLAEFLENWCHRDAGAGWKPDKSVRDTGPFTATLRDGKWVGEYFGTHQPVVIWYSKEMIEWLRENRPVDGSEPPAEAAPIPRGAIMIKEMYPAPAAACASVEPVTRLWPTSGAAVMVRAPEASHDGWFWGWFGWPGSGWAPDYPASNDANSLPNLGYGQYCMNCHASAEDGLTFADLENVAGEPGEPLVFLSQHFFDFQPDDTGHHRLVTLPGDDAQRLGQPHTRYDRGFVRSIPATSLPRPTWETVPMMPSETYDNTVVGPEGPTAASEFVTSSQCLGCHDAGSTGLQFDMTEPAGAEMDDPLLLLNLSPYATWRTSPMGLGGRDPIFYAMLASETETFHPEASASIQTICLGCHGIAGQRQFQIDRFDPATGECPDFLRETANAVPYPPDNPQAHLADYGALARDGINCTACHRMLVGEGEAPQPVSPENVCVVARQEQLNPDNTGFARTFTGSFLVGPPDRLIGPFEDPKTKPMENALGILPEYDETITSSEVCGSCHTVHLPVLYDGRPVTDGGEPVRTYEQTTYPEWAFSDYRTGKTAEGGKLPYGPGPKAESCQGCHMRSEAADGTPFRSKIASIQEVSNFPEAQNVLPAEELDLAVREGFARHTLVGLNVFFVKMAQQFPDVLGIRTQDPMLVSAGVDPLLLTEQKMLDQGSYETAEVSVDELSIDAGTLRAKVTVTSLTGHKFPSGVGFRRAFLELAVLDENGQPLWVSGATDGAGLLLGADGEPLPGELWWEDDCSALLHPDELVYQPHYQTITSRDQVQIYQELVTAPPGPDAECGLDAEPVPPLTTSFLSICGHVKDNRILPSGFLPLDERIAIAEALGAGEELARETGPDPRMTDPDYVTGGKDSLVYEVDLGEVEGTPAAVRATLYWQATPPYFLQDRFCTSRSADTQRLYFLAGHLDLGGSEAEDWKFELVSSGEVPVRGE